VVNPERAGAWFSCFPPAAITQEESSTGRRMAKTYDACDHTSARLGAADADRRIGPRDQKRARKAACTGDTPDAEARSTARSWTADLRRASNVRAGDRRRSWRVHRRTRIRSAPKRGRVPPSAPPSAAPLGAAFIRYQTAACCPAPAECVAYSFPSRSSMRPARLCRAMAAPTWFGRAPLHAALISCCVLPVAKART
jgi:hypothetical protein